MKENKSQTNTNPDPEGEPPVKIMEKSQADQIMLEDLTIQFVNSRLRSGVRISGFSNEEIARDCYDLACEVQKVTRD